MKSILRTAAAGLAIASFGMASAASAATENAQVTADILSTLQLAIDPSDNTLNFGTIADTGLTASSTVTVAPDAALACGADLDCTGTPATPTFTISGLVGSTVAVSFPDPIIQLDRAGAEPAGMSGQMDVGAFTNSLVGGQVLLATGTASFSIGGTLTVNPLQAPGIYTGAVEVEVQYN